MNEINLKSGRCIYANHGIIGLAPEDDKYFSICGGYDSSIPTNDYVTKMNDKGDEINEYVEWPKEDKLELCDIMIERWTKLRKAIENAPT